MAVPVLTAITHRWESRFAGMVERHEQVFVARRCADLAELLGCAAAGMGAVAAVSVDMRGVDRTAMATLSEHGVRVLGVFAPGDEAGQRALLRWGIACAVSADATEDQVAAALTSLLAGPAQSEPTRVSTMLSAPDDHLEDEAEARTRSPRLLPGDPEGTSSEDPQERPHDGQIVAVWGPTGAPGRSTVALNVAAELAVGESVMLVDADTYGACLGQMLAVLDEAPGIAAAVRAADNGTLDPTLLHSVACEITPTLHLLTGMPRADRWPELREHALADVLSQARHLADWTVVDIGFCLEQDEEVSFDTAAPRRNGATLRTLEMADRVLLVGVADPVGLQRLVRAYADVRELTQAACTVVVTRVRASSVGRDPRHQVQRLLSRLAGIETVHTVPEDGEAFDAAVLAGASLAEVRPTSSARRALVEVARSLSPRASPTAHPRSRLSARWRQR